MLHRSSRLPGFFSLSATERLVHLQQQGWINSSFATALSQILPVETATAMVENVIGVFGLPNAVAVNMRINGVDRIVPMVIEEPSVVAAVSNVARFSRLGMGFQTDIDAPWMIGQIQLVNVQSPSTVIAQLEAAQEELLERGRQVHPRLEERGGGIRGFEFRQVRYDEPGEIPEDMVIIHVWLDCRDAMGANMVNTLSERLAPHIERITGETVGLKILSNLADRRLARASIDLPIDALDPDPKIGLELAQRIASAWRFAWADPYRAVTHNKGVMNGMDAVAIATGNDWRALEAGAHAWCARSGTYRPMTSWKLDKSDSQPILRGKIEVPVQFGTVGGSIGVHPTVQANLALLGTDQAQELSGIAVAIGLAQNLGALKALASDGIQAGHMRMHARCVASAVGATPEEIPILATRLTELQDFSTLTADRELKAVRRGEQ